jgi:hypothetical protein
MIVQGQAAKVPVKLITPAGDDINGIAPAAIKNGVAQVIKADGTTQSISLVANTNWFEIDSTQSKGLYQLLIPNTATGQLGILAYTVYPAATQFIPFVGTTSVGIDQSTTATSTNVTAAITSIKGGSNKDNTQINTAITDAVSSIKGVSSVDLTQVAGTGFSTASDSLKQLSTALATITSSNIASAVWDTVRAVHVGNGTFGEALRIILQCLRGHVKIDVLNNTIIVYQEDGSTPLFTSALKDAAGNPANIYATERLAPT